MNIVVAASSARINKGKPSVWGNLKHEMKMSRRYKFLLLLLLPGIVYFIVFKYIPIYGLLLAFKDFNVNLGILASPYAHPWYKHIARLFSDMSGVGQATLNTIRISLLKMVFTFPAPIILALLFNEVYNGKTKKIFQTISYLPYFLSWIVVSSLIIQILSPTTGVVGMLSKLITPGKDAPMLLTDDFSFIVVLVVSEIWKGIGYGSIIYLAAIAGINPELYEAAYIDGANRLQRMTNITLPCLTPTITILFILGLGGILSANFDQIYNLYNPLVYRVADVLDTYIFRIGIGKFQYSFTTAVGLVRNVVAFLFVVAGNAVVRRISDYALW
jgi:putative aldouronate transport system permease protein